MSIKNKTFTETKYIQWLLPYYQNSLLTFEYYNLKIDVEAIKAIPRNLDVSLNDRRNYYNKKIILTDFLSVTLKGFMLILPVMNDLYNLYVEKNHILTERDFILIDLWFESLPVLDELILAFQEFKIKYKFQDHSTPEDSIFEYGCNDVVLKEVTGKNLKQLNCENWSKENFVDYIYNKGFAKIDTNLLYQWLNYKQIPNIYETKEEFVRQYITNETTGLKSLSLLTLKLLALNPLMDLDYIRERKKRRQEYQATLPTPSIEKIFKGLTNFSKRS